MAQACTEAVTALRRAGVSVRSVDIAGMLSTLAEAAHIVMVYEGARVHRQRWEAHGPRLGELADMVRTGLEIPDAQYEEARHQIERGRTRMRELFETTPVVLVPAATGPAPAGLASTGDPSMNSPWTALGTPAISVPMPVGSGLPLGLQLTAAHGQDGRLLGTAADVTRILDAGRR
jgi:Asp-tRNA(Asn)/Glu-tRNA(Gln) amidotransferase A subunit family amidase